MSTPPPWDNWDLLAETVGRLPDSPRALAAERAIQVLRSILGEDWLKTDGAQIPTEIALAASHTAAFAQLLELALRLQEFSEVPGAAVLRRSLKTSRAADSWRHVQLQLEIGALAAGAGAALTFEEGSRNAWPADVVVTVNAKRVPVEAFSVFTSQGWRDASRASDGIAERLLAVEFGHNLSIVADFHGSAPPREEVEDWLDRVEQAAEATAKDGAPRTVTVRAVSAQIAPEDRGPPSRFSGPPITFSPWERIVQRLEQKRLQASSSLDGVWLRVDFLDGMWQFSEWARYPLRQKLIVLEHHLRHEFAGAADLAGFIVSTGPALAQGAFVDETVQSESGSIGLRRNLPPVRVRETLIVPVAADASRTTQFFGLAYAAEPTSLDRSLQLAGLRTVDEIFLRQAAS